MTPKRLRILVGVTFLLLLLVVGLFLFQRSRNNDSSGNDDVLQPGESKVDLSPPTDEEKDAGNIQKEKLDNDTNSTPADSGNIAIKSIAKDPNNLIVVKTELTGTGWNECILTVTRGSNTITKKAGVLFQPTYSTCKGFAIDLNEFASGGDWNFSLVATKSDGNRGTAQKVFNVVK